LRYKVAAIRSEAATELELHGTAESESIAASQLVHLPGFLCGNIDKACDFIYF
jgi:hypothetical protein